jgi:hypothetical protein
MSRLPWVVLGAWVVLAAVAGVLATGQEDKFALVLTLPLAGFALVGALIANRQPRNAIGWLLLAVVMIFTLGNAIEAYCETASNPAPAVMWLDDWLTDVWILLVGVWIPLLFPDGRLGSRWRRRVAWFGTAVLAAGVVSTALGDHDLDTSAPGTHHNPFALPGAAGDLLASLVGVTEVLYALAVLGAMAGLVLRLRRSRGIERQQLKWFAYVTALMLAALMLAAVSLVDEERFETVGAFGWGAFLLLAVVGLPVAMGFSILRHRLYDIDVVINRTLVYGALTVTLGAVYLGLVLLLGLAVGRSNLSIAVSTLAVAALFRPVRSRIQAAVDRRFYRRRYDAAQTLHSFGTRLRDELDVDSVGAHLHAAVRETVQPAHVSLWLPRNDSRTHGP